MKKELNIVISSLIATILISGCGGGTSTVSQNTQVDNPKPATVKKLTGYYIDSAISGANYDCETTSGVTDNEGKFKFEAGHNCKFYLSNKLLKSVNKDRLFDGVYIIETRIKTATVLQTLDLDGNASNGIEISAEAKACLNSPIESIDTSKLKDCLDNSVSGYRGHEVSETEAKEHIEQTVKQFRPTAIDSSVTANEETPKTITLPARDQQGDTLRFYITKQPNHGTLSGNETSGVVTYTPNRDFNGEDSFKFKASDGTFESNEATINITVNPTNDVPTAYGQNITTNEDSTKPITLTGSDIDGDSLRYTVTQQPAHGSLSGTGSNLSYRPNPNYNGEDSFKFKVNDGKANSSEATINITVNPINDAPTASNITASTNENSAKAINLAGRDIDSNNLTYIISQNPTNGTVTINGSVATYTPKDGYSGDDSFKYKANDGSLDSNEATVSIEIVPVNLHITEDYKVINLGKDKTINKKIYLDSNAKNLYLVLSNDSNSASSATVNHNAKVTNKVAMNRLSTTTTKVKVLKDKKEALEFSKNIHKFLKNIKINNNRLYRVAPSYSVSEGDTHTFFLDWYGDDTIDAKLKKIVSNVNTKFGDKTLYVWVANDAFEGANCNKSKCVNQDMVDTLADNFLKDGSNNDIYDWVTNIYGEEWGPANNSNLIAESNRIDILLMDISNDDSANGGIVGYFYGKDNIVKGDGSNNDPRPAGSNERIMFYIDSVMYANRDNGDFWEKEVYSTLAHEFQHMINFYQKGVLEQAPTATWLNEMMSLTTEDLVATKISTEGVRGVASNDGSAGSSQNAHGRFSRFNLNNDMTLTNWSSTLEDYSKASSFGTFLVRNYGGAQLMSNLMHNSLGAEDAIIKAIKDTTGEDITFSQLLQKWGIAIMLSDNTNLSSDLPKYNFGDFLTLDYNGVSYDMGSINFFNYSQKPKLHESVESINPHANYYYKIGENITSNVVDLNITLDANTSATLIAK